MIGSCILNRVGTQIEMVHPANPDGISFEMNIP